MENSGQKSFKVNIGIITLACLLVTQIVLFAFGYGAITQQVAFNRELIQSYQTNQVNIMNKLDDVNIRLTKLETIIARIELQ